MTTRRPVRTGSVSDSSGYPGDLQRQQFPPHQVRSARDWLYVGVGDGPLAGGVGGGPSGPQGASSTKTDRSVPEGCRRTVRTGRTRSTWTVQGGTELLARHLNRTDTPLRQRTVSTHRSHPLIPNYPWQNQEFCLKISTWTRVHDQCTVTPTEIMVT